MSKIDEKRIAIICDGKEISYGMSLLHLMQYLDEDIHMKSSMCQNTALEIYSKSTFKHSNVSKKTIKIHIGTDEKAGSAGIILYNKYGMKIVSIDNDLYLLVENVKENLNTYSEFLTYANNQRKKYIKDEKDYYKSISERNLQWIPDVFEQLTTSKGLFSKLGDEKKRIQQKYDCLAFAFYNEFLKVYIES